jgi:NifU-like protein
METGLLPTDTGGAAPQAEIETATIAKMNRRMNIVLILSKTALVAKLKRVPMYPEDIAELIRKPRFCGALTNSNAKGAEAKFDCGCFVSFEMLIGGQPERIEAVAYRTNGCGFMIAAAELISTRLESRQLTDLHGLIDGPPAPETRSDCWSATLKAAKAAFAGHRDRRVEEFRGERALICTCFGIAEETVEEFVRSSSPIDVNDVSASLRAGSGCGSCRMLIQEIIDANA